MSSAVLSQAVVRRALRLAVVEGLLSSIFVSITAGAFLTGFALFLGASPFELGVIGALPFVSQLFQFVGAYLEEQRGERRRLTIITSALSRILWAAIALLPFLGLGRAWQLILFLLLLTASQALIGIAINAWTSWMTDLVPARQRGRYFGFRNTVASVTAIVSTWLAGWALDYFRASGQEVLGYSVMFGAATMVAMAAVLVLGMQAEPPMQRRQRVNVAELFSAPLRAVGFRRLSLLATGWAIATGIAGPFFNAYGIQTLNLSFQMLAQFAIATSATSIIAQPIVGRLQDRYGSQTIMIISMLGVVPLPWGWVLSTPESQIPLWITSALAGVFWPGIIQGQMNIVMEQTPTEGRGAFLAFFGAVNGIGTFVSGLLGGAIAAWVGPQIIQLGPATLTQYSILFVASSLGRLLMVGLFARRMGG